jgi:hypothetical protein
MSAMSTLHSQILDLLMQGYKPEEVAEHLGIPLDWVMAVVKSITE